VCGSEDAAALARIHGLALTVAALVRLASRTGAGCVDAVGDTAADLAVEMLTMNRYRNASVNRVPTGRGACVCACA
jgi:hypothetical protein